MTLIDWILDLLNMYIGLYSANWHEYGFVVGSVRNIIFACLTFGAIFFVYLLITGIRGDKTGEKFERKVAGYIRKYLKLEVYQNLILDTGNEHRFFTFNNYHNIVGENVVKDTTEADMVFATKKGIFVVECKLRNSDIFGVDGEQEWTVHNLQESGISTMLNPFLQNEKHINTLQKYVEENCNMKYHAYNLVVAKCRGMHFTRHGVKVHNEVFSNMLLSHNEALIALTDSSECTPKKAFKAFRQALNEMEDVYSEKEVEKLNEYLSTLQGTKKQRKEHVSNLDMLDYYARDEEKSRKQYEKYLQKEMGKKAQDGKKEEEE